MARGEFYNTKQKELILEVIKKYTNQFTIKDIYNEVKDKTGLTTIYRLVDKLVDDGTLRKIIGKDKMVYYQYLDCDCSCKNHFYLKCDCCGRLIHVDCDCIKNLTDHIYKKHKFRQNNEHIIINGICEKCINKGE